jgi:hypothetical protein
MLAATGPVNAQPNATERVLPAVPPLIAPAARE